MDRQDWIDEMVQTRFDKQDFIRQDWIDKIIQTRDMIE